ncbi:MT organizer Mto1 [Schizosaccharomyces japonicus yFS275]|uniref:MT organizer Mto1 n=1 Tax=Schizosaccharomyces japonicus (strain yFS275 / FY16936) TaxID=402676 RepID=B6K118_SCHJY|nr:MT organizer Mto1 [Schizosaccharomyces japonicus yFS275]EEB07639.1 MT organizer Mto1 [Schizosaccharomyces japonicus yFS275]
MDIPSTHLDQNIDKVVDGLIRLSLSSSPESNDPELISKRLARHRRNNSLNKPFTAPSSRRGSFGKHHRKTGTAESRLGVQRSFSGMPSSIGLYNTSTPLASSEKLPFPEVTPSQSSAAVTSSDKNKSTKDDGDSEDKHPSNTPDEFPTFPDDNSGDDHDDDHDDERLSPVLLALHTNEQDSDISDNEFTLNPHADTNNLLGRLDDELNPQSPRVTGSNKLSPNDLENEIGNATNINLQRRLSDISIPASALNELQERHESIRRELKEAQPSSTLTLKEQAQVIDNLRKEVFGLKLKCYFLYDQLNKFHDQDMKDVMKQNVDLKTLTMELQRTVVGYEKKNQELQRELEQAMQSAAAAKRDYVNGNERPSSSSTQQFTESEQELILKMLEKERSENAALTKELDSLRIIAKNNTDPNSQLVESLQRNNNLLRKDLSTLNESLMMVTYEKDQLLQQLDNAMAKMKEEKERVLLDAEKSQNEIWDQMISFKMKTQEQAVELARLQRELDSLESDSEGKLSKMEAQWKEDVEHLQQFAEDLTADLEQKKEELTRTTKESQTYESALNTLRQEAEAELDKLDKIIKDNGESINLFKTEIERLNEELSVMTENYDKKCDELDSLKKNSLSKESEHAAELANIRSEKQSLENSLKEANDDYHVLQEELDSMRTKISECETSLSDKEQQIKTLQSENEQHLSLEEDLKDQLKKSESELSDLREQCQQLSAEEIAIQQQKCEDLKKETAQLQQEKSKLNKDYTVLQRRYSVLEQRLNSLEDGIVKTFDRKVDHCSTEILLRQIKWLKEIERHNSSDYDMIQRKVTRLEQSLKDRDNALDNANVERKELKVLLDSEKRAKKMLQNQYESLKQLQRLSQLDAVGSSPSGKAKVREIKSLQQMERKFKEQSVEQLSYLQTFVQRLGKVFSINGLPSFTPVSSDSPGSSFLQLQRSADFCLKEADHLLTGVTRKYKVMERSMVTEMAKLSDALDACIKRTERLEGRLQSNSSLIPGSPRGRTSRSISRESVTRRSMDDRRPLNVSKEKLLLQKDLGELKRDTDEMGTVWLARLRDMEFQLKAEQEARRRDNKGAKERLDELLKHNRDLTTQLSKDRAYASRTGSWSSTKTRD